MPFAYKILAQGVSTSAATGTYNTIYTVPAGKSVIINRIDLTNNSSNAVAALLRIVPSGATAAVTHAYGPLGTSAGTSIAQEAMRTYTGPITLNAGDFIQLSSGTANVINFHIFGIEVS